MSCSSNTRLAPRPVAFAVLLLGSLGLSAAESSLQVRNLTRGVITVVRTCETWQPGLGAYVQGRAAARRHLKPGETASFPYQVAGKQVEGCVVIRHLGENGLIHHDGFTIRSPRPGAKIPPVGAQSLAEELPTIPEEEEADLEG